MAVRAQWIIALMASLTATAGCVPSRSGETARPVNAGRPANEVLALALAGDSVYARTSARRIRVWNAAQGTLRDLGREGVVSLSADAAVAISSTRVGAEGVLLNVWELSSGQTIRTRLFPQGARALRSSRFSALLELATPTQAASSWQRVLPAQSEIAAWDLGTDQLEKAPGARFCELGGITNDGMLLACDTTVWDKRAGRLRFSPAIAPEWEPPRESDPGVSALRSLSWTPFKELLSVWLAPDGGALYLTYNGMAAHQEWRLEKWLIHPAGAGPDQLERLAVSRKQLADQVLAASHDGHTVVTGGPGKRLALRRAPRYDLEPLPVSFANVATFSADDERLVTGHEDGTMCLWDTRTLSLLASSEGAPIH